MLKEFCLKVLPAGLRERIKKSQDFRNILSNTGWLFSDKIIRMAIGVFVSIWVARYLGPEQFGLINFATAFVALIGVVASLGMNNIVVRELVQQPENKNTILGAAFILQFLAGILSFVLVVIAIYFFQPDDELLRLIVIVFGFVLVFKASEVAKYWFESQVLSKYTVWVDSSVFLLISLIQIILILNHASLMAFVWVTVAGGLLVSIGYLWVYLWRVGKITVWRFDYKRSKTLLKDSWPLLLSGLAIMVYMRIDQIMLGQLLGNGAVGIYSAAVRISEVWYFIPMAIAASVFPSVIKLKKKNEKNYIDNFQKLFNLMVILGFAVAIPASFFSDWIITFLFGHEYREAGTVLIVHIWSGVFVSLGLVSGLWLVNENLQKLALYRTLAGAVLNIFLNLYLIPSMGVVGAAVGTLLSQIVAAYMFDIINARTRPIFWMKTRAFYSIFLFLFKKEPVP